VRQKNSTEKIKNQSEVQKDLGSEGFSVELDNRVYQVKGMIRTEIHLKATIQVFGKEGKKRFFLDNLDLYSHKSRALFAKGCSKMLGEPEDGILKDLTNLIELTENFQESDGTIISVLSRSEEEEAMTFLRNPNLLECILKDFETMGYTGEETNKLVGYLATVSRKLEEPLSLLIQSRSAAGKSTLQDALLSLVPPEDYTKYTRLTGQALFYSGENALVHQVLAIEEEAGTQDASYSIRILQSAQKLSIASTGRDPVTGRPRMESYQMKGPVCLMFTTTSVDLDEETANRFLTLTIDESKKMTEKILVCQRKRVTLEGMIQKANQEAIRKKHHHAQRLLKPLRVVNPYAPLLTFPEESLRARRDHQKYLYLIQAVAFLHQYQREIKTCSVSATESFLYIEVTLEDIERVNRWAAELLGQALDELSPPSRALLGHIRHMVIKKSREKGMPPGEYRFTRREIRNDCQWSDFQIKCHIRQLQDLEYLHTVSGKWGKEFIYTLPAVEGGEDGKMFLPGLMSVSKLKKVATERGLVG
jgi:energy-coupling factor transporter ATP-binding protein EcfA2